MDADCVRFGPLNRKRWCCFVWFVAFCAATGSIHAADSDAAKLRAAAQQYQENRDSFRQFSCDFTIRNGTAQDIEKALANGPDEVLSAAEYQWTVDKDAECFRFVREIPIAKKEADRDLNEGRTRASPFPQDSFLRGGGFDFCYYARAEGAAISRTVPGKLLPMEITPFSLGAMGEGERASPSKKILSDDNTVNLEVLEISEAAVRFCWSKTDREHAHIYEYSLSPQWRHAIKETSVRLGEDRWIRAVVTDVRDCGGGRCFPIRSICIRKLTADGPYQIREIKVDKLDVDTPIDKDRLAIEVSADCAVNDQSEHSSQFITSAPTRLTPEKLPKVWSLTREAIEEGKRYLGNPE